MTISSLRGKSVAAMFLAAALAASGANAQPKPEGRAGLVQRLLDCRKLTDDSARLACYDQATTAFDQAEAKGDIVVVDREQARKVRRQAFGFSLPSISLFERGESKEEVDNVTGQIAALRYDPMGKLIVRLADGATWAQIDTTPMHRTPKTGMSVRIRRASLGSFIMSIEGGGGFRVKRTE